MARYEITATKAQTYVGDALTFATDYTVIDTANGRKLGTFKQEPYGTADEAFAKAEARVALLEALAAAGQEVIVRRWPAKTRAEAYRMINRRVYVIVDTDGTETTYTSWDEIPVPAPVEAVAVEAVEVETVEVETVEVVETEAPIVRGTATDAQVDLILDLLAEYGTGTGWMAGPTTEAGVRAMDRSDASTYIDSLRGTY